MGGVVPFSRPYTHTQQPRTGYASTDAKGAVRSETRQKTPAKINSSVLTEECVLVL